MTVSSDVLADRVNFKNGTCDSLPAGDLHHFLRETRAADTSRVLLVEDAFHYGNCSECRRLLKDEWLCPPLLFESMCYKLNGYANVFKQDVGAGVLDTIKHLKCLVKPITMKGNWEVDYEWHEMTIFIRIRDSGQLSMICFGTPANFYRDLERALLPITLDAPGRSDADHLETAVVQEVTKLYDDSVWKSSEAIRKIEKNRSNFDQPVDGLDIPTKYARMHELLRHAIHTSEILQVAVDSFQELARPLAAQIVPSGQSCAVRDRMPLTQYDFAGRVLQSLLLRSRSNESRLKNEIQLAMNLVAQADSSATVDLSISAKRDSTAMRVIAVVTLIFFPATFVATLFSMSFFNYDQDPTEGWRVTGKIWIYFAVAVPLTVVTFIAWRLLQIRIRHKSKRDHIIRQQSFRASRV